VSEDTTNTPEPFTEYSAEDKAHLLEQAIQAFLFIFVESFIVHCLVRKFRILPPT